ncbi:MAG: amidohydrolase, partial [Candidatus Aphodousia sp.]|nr:amidohydrolase [Candidatus Aphodousia sp.]
MWDLLIKDCRVVDPKNTRNEVADIAIVGNKIDCVGQDLSADNAREVLHFPNMIAQPGIIDMHLHLGLNPFGFKIVALVGVTTALDMSGETD